MFSLQHSTVSILNHLINTCRDFQLTYSSLSQRAPNDEFKMLFSRLAEQRASFAAELEKEVRRLGTTPVGEEHMAPLIRRQWPSPETMMNGQDIPTLVLECERGEEQAKMAYEHILQYGLGGRIRSLVRQQHDEIIKAQERIKLFEVASRLPAP